MTQATQAPGIRLTNPSGLTIELNANGSLRRIDFGETIVNLFLGNELEGGPANIYLRTAGEFTPLLGPRSATVFQGRDATSAVGYGRWQGLRYRVALRLAQSAPAWFWQVTLDNDSDGERPVDLVYAQDLALAPYDTVRMNEYYVSQYVDHTPLTHARVGVAVASRQNLPAGGKHPWSVIGSLRRCVSYATDALQLHGLATRAGQPPVGIAHRLSGRRLQHEHSMVVLQDETVRLTPRGSADCGFFGVLTAHHAGASGPEDLDAIDRALQLPEAVVEKSTNTPSASVSRPSLFVTAPCLRAIDLSADEASALFGSSPRHVESDQRGERLSFFTGEHAHVVLRSKELHVERPHGHVLRTGAHATPDEQALTTTVWMNGVFNSMLTQGHVSFNRMLSTTRSYLGLFRSHGQRVFAEIDGHWQLLDVPSAFEMQPNECRWLYRHAHGLIEVRTQARSEPHEVVLAIRVLIGAATRFLITHHIALNGDDGATRCRAHFERRGPDVFVAPALNTELHQRFPGGGFVIVPGATTQLEAIGGDELLYEDQQSRHEPLLCLSTQQTTTVRLTMRGKLIDDSPDLPSKLPADAAPAMSRLLLTPAANSPQAAQVERIADIIPWFTHDAFIHYLSPRGLEQYTGGGWGTRDVTQGPVELLLSSGHAAPMRDLLLRVMRAQKADGDWPQWFMFFERDRAIRAGDSHGDIVFWPVLAVAQYMLACGDASLLEERVPFFDTSDGPLPTVWQHVERALALIERRVVDGTALAAYGHGDWNDALQPADPAMRDHMCSAWTVTLHHQVLTTLARALRAIGRAADAPRFEKWAEAVQRDFRSLLIVDGVLAGYALFEAGQARYLLHPRDAVSGVHYSSLAMIHALLEDMFTPEQARAHLALMDEHLLGPDGMRLFDRPMNYHGGPMRFFQRAESATFFGREIGLMYMHAHLRYAQALARMGEAERFFKALCQANPIGIRSLVPQATLRQANCYYSSSDAAFEDRYQASAEYDRIKHGKVGLDGGWRVYSSGAGIALSLIVRRFLGLNLEADALCLDPVMPASLSGLRVDLEWFGTPVDITYEITGKGCGVAAVTVNGSSIAFTRDANPYRDGAARVPLEPLRQLVAGKHASIRVSVG